MVALALPLIFWVILTFTKPEQGDLRVQYAHPGLEFLLYTNSYVHQSHLHKAKKYFAAGLFFSFCESNFLKVWVLL